MKRVLAVLLVLAVPVIVIGQDFRFSERFGRRRPRLIEVEWRGGAPRQTQQSFAPPGFRAVYCPTCPGGVAYLPESQFAAPPVSPYGGGYMPPVPYGAPPSSPYVTSDSFPAPVQFSGSGCNGSRFR